MINLYKFLFQAVFKIPMAKPLVPLRQTGFGIKKLSLLRPSSGYYSYNVKKVDSDTESGRFSSNNVSGCMRSYLLMKSLIQIYEIIFTESIVRQFKRKFK